MQQKIKEELFDFIRVFPPQNRKKLFQQLQQICVLVKIREIFLCLEP